MAGQRGHAHPVVVDQFQVAGRRHQHLGMLKIAMRYFRIDQWLK
jgi:hypothetical protein